MSAYENFHCTSNLGPSLVGPWKILTTNLDKRGLLTGEEYFGKINGTFRKVMEARMRHSVCWKTIKCITINQYKISQVN